MNGGSARRRLYSERAEHCAVAALMVSPAAFWKVHDFLKPEHFYIKADRLIFEAIERLAQNPDRDAAPIDPVSVAEEMERAGTLDQAGGMAYLIGLYTGYPSAANVVNYGRTVADLALRRALEEQAQIIARSPAEEGAAETAELLESATQRIFELQERIQAGKGPRPAKAFLRAFIDELEERRNCPDGITGLPSGLSDLDKKLAGFHRSDFYVIGGRTGMGKTALLTKIVDHVSLDLRQSILLFELEMSEPEMIGRVAASRYKIPAQKIRTGQLEEHEWALVSRTAEDVAGSPEFLIDGQPGLSLTQIRARAISEDRRLKAEGSSGLACILVDHLGLVRMPDFGPGQKVQETGEVTRRLKELAKELRVPVIAIAQVNRGVEQRQDKRPLMSDLRNSGDIEQDADCVLLLYRDDYYYPDSQDRGIAEILITKNRHGSTGVVRVSWQDELTRFSDLASESRLPCGWETKGGDQVPAGSTVSASDNTREGEDDDIWT